MVSIKEAVSNAVTFAQAALGADRTVNIRLEEVESGVWGGDDCWFITLSMGATPLLKREYKIFTVRKNDGEVTSMKIRELAGA